LNAILCWKSDVRCPVGYWKRVKDSAKVWNLIDVGGATRASFIIIQYWAISYWTFYWHYTWRNSCCAWSWIYTSL